jgi:hypothetical protein
MSRTDMDRFRRRCGQLRWLAYVMVVSVGLLLFVLHIVGPAVVWHRGDAEIARALVAPAILASPSLFYLYAVWALGGAMGELAQGSLFQPTVVSALRRVGLALGLGGVASVFGVVNLARLVTGNGSFLHWDVSGMTLGMVGGALFLLGGLVEQAGRVQAELDEMI